MSSEVLPNSDVASVVTALPHGASMLCELARLVRKDVNIDEMAGLIARESAFADAVVVAAQRFAGEEQHLDSVEAAISHLGDRETFHLAGAVAWRELTRVPLRLYNVSADPLWRGGLFTGLLMQELSPAAGVESTEAFVAGLLRSVGKIVLDELAHRTAEIPPYSPGEESLPQWEQELLGYTNTEVAAAVFEVWRFPLELATGVRCHYEPTPATPLMAHLLNLAAATADLRGYGITGEEEYWNFNAARMSACNLDRETIAAAEGKASMTLQRIVAACGS